tara:strand:- start:11700 stop:12008 length:309 start_codon:yes stop_codon:yes gene_type:complete
MNKEKTAIDIENKMATGIGPYERKRIEKRTKNGKTESVGRIVDPAGKKVYSMYKGPKGKKYKLTEELGAVQRRGVDLSQTKKGGKIKTKLLPEKINRNKKRP